MTLTSLECIVIFFRKYLQLYIKETICRVFILYMKFFELFLSCLPFLNGLDYRDQIAHILLILPKIDSIQKETFWLILKLKYLRLKPSSNFRTHSFSTVLPFLILTVSTLSLAILSLTV